MGSNSRVNELSGDRPRVENGILKKTLEGRINGKRGRWINGVDDDSNERTHGGLTIEDSVDRVGKK